MEINADQLLIDAIKDGLRKGIADKITGYGSPLDALIKSVIEGHSGALRSLLDSAITTAINTDSFQKEITAAVHRNLAKTLVQRFGGEVEKQVNILKSDPTTRARITLAIEEIVKSKTT